MCLAIPGKILKTDHRTGTVEIMGVTKEVSVELLKEVKAGDYVLIHAGCAIQKLDEEEALKTLEIMKELKEIIHD